jgi:hypothetical protein
MVFAVSLGYSMDSATARRLASGRSDSRTFATAVQCSGARRPTREYIRIGCVLSYLSM